MSFMASPSMYSIHCNGNPTRSLSFDFVAKAHNPSVHDPRFEEFTIPSLDNLIMDGDRDKLLLFLIRAFRKCLSRVEQYRPGMSNLYISASKREKRASQNNILFWIRLVISQHMNLFLMRTAHRLRSRHTKSERLCNHCCSGGIIQSSKY